MTPDIAAAPEVIYRLTYEHAWADLLDVLHQHHAALDDDPLLAQAASIFADAFFADLEAAPAEAYHGELEKLFLLHAGGQFRLPEARFGEVVEYLVRLHTDQPEAALGYARFCPERPACAAVLRQHTPAEPLAETDAVRLDAHGPVTGADATISLLRSQQEVDFFLAMREVFATYLVYPNAALSSLVDFEQIKAHLSARERQYFFRGLVDCVVFDQQDGYRPRYFVEVDSPLHDDPARRARDAMKARILTLAGQTLYRVRPHGASPGPDGFARLIRACIAS